MVRRGILILLAVLMAMTVATVARAGGGASPMGCTTDPVSNIIWCSY